VSEQVRRKLKAAMQENARLQAEVERLRKAGDAMADTLEVEGYIGAIKYWHAAKEGKQS
jgi:regulator of replication initiation timing